MSDSNNDFDWVTDKGESGSRDEEELAAVEHLREEAADLKRERYHLRQRIDDIQQKCKSLQEENEALKQERDTEQREVQEVQENAIEVYEGLSTQYDEGVPKQMLVGTLETNCEADEKQAERAIRGLINSGRFVEEKHHIKKPE